MRYLGEILAQVRLQTDNEDTSTADGVTVTGIRDEEFIQYFNDAQDRLQSRISSANSPYENFVVESEIDIVSGQEEYDIPDRLFFNKEVRDVAYSPTGLAVDYLPLRKEYFINRSTQTATYPSMYYRRFGKICINPIPSSSTGKLRVLYERSLDDLDIRRGQISDVSGLTETTFSSITLDTTADVSSTTNLTNAQFICVVDAYGAVKAYNIPVGSFTSSTRVLAPSSSHAFASGETIAAGDYVVIGKYTTTHSLLPDECERYLIKYCSDIILGRDASAGKAMFSQELMDMETEIVAMMKSQTSEIQGIPQQDYSEWW